MCLLLLIVRLQISLSDKLFLCQWNKPIQARFKYIKHRFIGKLLSGKITSPSEEARKSPWEGREKRKREKECVERKRERMKGKRPKCLDTEEPWEEGQSSSCAGKFRVVGRICQVGTEGYQENLEARSALISKIHSSVPCPRSDIKHFQTTDSISFGDLPRSRIARSEEILFYLFFYSLGNFQSALHSDCANNLHTH